MTPDDYLNSVKALLLNARSVIRFHIVRQRVTASDCYLRVRVDLIDASRLEFSEYAQTVSSGEIQVATYSYHWQDASATLIRRWDNTPHFPGLQNFPHHVHLGAEGNVTAGQPQSVFTILADIERMLYQV